MLQRPSFKALQGCNNNSWIPSSPSSTSRPITSRNGPSEFASSTSANNEPSQHRPQRVQSASVTGLFTLKASLLPIVLISYSNRTPFVSCHPQKPPSVSP